MDGTQVLKQLKKYANPKNVEGMARFGINPKKTLGVSIPILRKMAKEIGKDHALAAKLWQSGIHEARILAGMVDDPKQVTPKQMDGWAREFDSWDVCDQVCMNLFGETKYAYAKAKQWAKSNHEFVRRAGFAMMAVLAWQDKDANDSAFVPFFTIIKQACTDDRNYVKKAVNWALRQMGKRNKALNKLAIKTAKEIQKIDSKAAQWVANDVIRELMSSPVQRKIHTNKKAP